MRTILSIFVVVACGLSVSPATAATDQPPSGFSFWMPKGGTNSAADIDTFWRKGSRVCVTGLNFWFRGTKAAGRYEGVTLNQNGPPLSSVLTVRRRGDRLRFVMRTEPGGTIYLRSIRLKRTTKAYIRALPNGEDSLKYWTRRSVVCGRY